MGFPIKRRNTCTNPNVRPPHYGLDLPSVVVDARPQRAVLSTRSSPEEMVITSPSMTCAEEVSSSDNTDSISAPSSSNSEQQPKPHSEAIANTRSSNGHKRAKAFPQILLEILSNPDYVPIVSWLPDGKTFAVHDPTKFSTEILPKYFRRVIFRSFIRKLNRWGFRTVKRSVSGLGSTFEHKHFCRDQPELVAKMNCKSNPVSKATLLAASNIISAPSNSELVISASSALATAAQVPRARATLHANAGGGIPAYNEEFLIRFRNELILQEMRHQRQRQHALMQLAHHMPITDADVESQFAGENLRCVMMQQQQGGEYNIPRL